jgi:hypothetical protein
LRMILSGKARANACKRPCPPGMAAASQPATPTWRRLYRLVPRGLAPIHPAGQVTLSQEGSRLPTTCRHPIRPGSNYSIFISLFLLVCFFFFKLNRGKFGVDAQLLPTLFAWFGDAILAERNFSSSINDHLLLLGSSLPR